MKLHEIVREGVEELHDLKCVNGAMYFGSVETPCSGRDAGECCHNEQTNEEACAELDNYFKHSHLSLLEAVKKMVEGNREKNLKCNFCDTQVCIHVFSGGEYNQALSDISTTLSEEINLIKNDTRTI